MHLGPMSVSSEVGNVEGTRMERSYIADILYNWKHLEHQPSSGRRGEEARAVLFLPVPKEHLKNPLLSVKCG